MEMRSSQAIEVAPGERDRQRRAAADAPRPMGRLDRVPGQVPARATATPLPVRSPIPWLPQSAAPSTPAPGVQLPEARRHFCIANGGGPSVEVAPQIAHDAYQRHPARAERAAAYRLPWRHRARAVLPFGIQGRDDGLHLAGEQCFPAAVSHSDAVACMTSRIKVYAGAWATT
jgi:hypothetical protein